MFERATPRVSLIRLTGVSPGSGKCGSKISFFARASSSAS